MCDRVAIMYLGRIVETGPARAIFETAAPSLYAGAARRRTAAGAWIGSSAAASSRASRRARASCLRAAPSARAARMPRHRAPRSCQRWSHVTADHDGRLPALARDRRADRLR